MMSEEIINVINDLCSKFGIAIDWASENIMPKLSELFEHFITYKIITYSIWSVIGIALLITGIILTRNAIKSYKYCLTNKKDTLLWNWWNGSATPEDCGIVIMFIIGLCLIAGVSITFCNVAGLLKSIFIPEMVVFDYITDIVVCS